MIKDKIKKQDINAFVFLLLFFSPMNYVHGFLIFYQTKILPYRLKRAKSKETKFERGASTGLLLMLCSHKDGETRY